MNVIKLRIFCVSRVMPFQHDTTLWALMGTLDSYESVFRSELPGYAAALAFQLWNITGIGPTVKVR
jgi:hypothetical protein